VSTVADALIQARALGVARLDAQWLLAQLLRRPRAWLLAHGEEALTPVQASTLNSWLQRRAHGEPLAYVTGEQEFRGLALRVTPAVLIPRPETELLVEWALECAAAAPTGDIIDLGTGSGAVALALRQACPGRAVCATDASAEALALARANAAHHGLDIECVRGDWWQAVPGRHFALAVSNPPYVAGDDPHLDALTHEPRAALTPEGDGLAALRRIIKDAPAHLPRGAWLLLEHGHDQDHAVRALLEARGFSNAQTRCDLARLPRCSGAQWLARENRAAQP
jgi:release factor glutamine methyltransferase